MCPHAPRAVFGRSVRAESCGTERGASSAGAGPCSRAEGLRAPSPWAERGASGAGIVPPGPLAPRRSVGRLLLQRPRGARGSLGGRPSLGSEGGRHLAAFPGRAALLFGGSVRAESCWTERGASAAGSGCWGGCLRVCGGPARAELSGGARRLCCRALPPGVGWAVGWLWQGLFGCAVPRARRPWACFPPLSSPHLRPSPSPPPHPGAGWLGCWWASSRLRLSSTAPPPTPFPCGASCSFTPFENLRPWVVGRWLVVVPSPCGPLVSRWRSAARSGFPSPFPSPLPCPRLPPRWRWCRVRWRSRGTVRP